MGETIEVEDDEEEYTPMEVNTAEEEYDPTETLDDTEMCYKPAPVGTKGPDDEDEEDGYTPAPMQKLSEAIANSDSEEEDTTVLHIDNLDGDGKSESPQKDVQQAYKENMDNLNTLRSQKLQEKTGKKKKKGRKKK